MQLLDFTKYTSYSDFIGKSLWATFGQHLSGLRRVNSLEFSVSNSSIAIAYSSVPGDLAIAIQEITEQDFEFANPVFSADKFDLSAI